MSATVPKPSPAQPFFCADCDALLEGAGTQQRDGRFICPQCVEKLKRATEAKRQGALFEEQRSLFNPRRNTEGFKDASGQFHPIRKGKDYNEFKAGDFDTEKQKARREQAKESKAREQYKEEEKFYVETERKQQRGRGARGRARDRYAGRSLAQFVRGAGGIVPGGMFAGEIRRLGFKETGTTGLLNQKARQGSHKQTAEYVMDAANESGYTDGNGQPFTDIGAFLSAVELSAVKGVDPNRRRGPIKAERDKRALAKAYAAPVANPAGDEWDDIDPELLDEAARLGDKQARALGRDLRELSHTYEVSWYSPDSGRRVTLGQHIEANTRAAAVQEAKALLGYDRFKRKAPALRPVNFIAKEVRSNPKQREYTPDARCNTCGQRADRPYRAHDQNGKIISGCIDDIHTGHLVTPSNSSAWHNRPAAKKWRAETKNFFNRRNPDSAGIERLAQALIYWRNHRPAQATRAEIKKVATRFGVNPKTMETAVAMMAGGVNAAKQGGRSNPGGKHLYIYARVKPEVSGDHHPFLVASGVYRSTTQALADAKRTYREQYNAAYINDLEWAVTEARFAQGADLEQRFGRRNPSPYEEGVAKIEAAILRAIAEMKRDGTVAMSAANLKQVLSSAGGLRGVSFPNQYAANQAFQEALQRVKMPRGFRIINPGNPGSKYYLVEVSLKGNDGEWHMARKPIMARDGVEARQEAVESLLIAGGERKTRSSGITGAEIEYKIGKAEQVSKGAYATSRKRWGNPGYKRADDFEYVGIASRMKQQPREMLKAYKAGDTHEALQHALDILRLGAGGYIGTPAYKAAERMRDKIRGNPDYLGRSVPRGPRKAKAAPVAQVGQASNPKLEVGDRVRYATKFLRSIGAYTGDMPFARGTVTDLSALGRSGFSQTTLARIDWDGNHDLPDRVNTANLEKIKKRNPGEVSAVSGSKAGTSKRVNPGGRGGRSEVRSPTSTRTEVRSPTSTSTEVRSPTRTSTYAKTHGNITVTGGAGRGANTTVTIRRNPAARMTKARALAMMVQRIKQGAHSGYYSEVARKLGASDLEIANAISKGAEKRYGKRARSNPSIAQVSREFQGRSSGNVAQFKAAASAPADLARIGKLRFLKIAGGKQLSVPGAMVAADTKGRLWIVGNRAPMFSRKARPGEGLDFGPVKEICYITAKAHIGKGKTFEYIHKFGEDGGQPPHLIIDQEGMPILKGGSYKIESRGIVN